MAYVYLSDGGPESEDYDSNYFYFDETNKRAVKMIETMLSSNAERDAAFREVLQAICRSSLNRTDSNRRKIKSNGYQWFRGLSRWAKQISLGDKTRYVAN